MSGHFNFFNCSPVVPDRPATIETALPQIETTLPKIETALPEIKTARVEYLLEVQNVQNWLGSALISH